MANDSTAQAGTNQETDTTQVQAERTFTQAELDSIVKSRLYEEKKKLGDYESHESGTKFRL